MSNFEHAKYDANGVRIDDPTFNTQALREDTSLVNGVTFPAADTVAINTASVERLRIGNAGQTTLLANSASAALTVTQTGAGNAFVVEDSASTDSTPFAIDASGRVILGAGTSPTFQGFQRPLFVASTNALGVAQAVIQQSSLDTTGSTLFLAKTRGTTPGSKTVVVSGDNIGQVDFVAADGTADITAARIRAEVDGTPGTDDMPGRLIFSTTADGASSPTERMRIDSAGNVGIGGSAAATVALHNSKQITGGSIAYGIYSAGQIQSGTVTSSGTYFQSVANTSAGTTTNVPHYAANQGTFTGSVAAQFGFLADATLTGATNNYGFYSNIAAAANRYNFYAAGTAANYFAGDIQLGKTVTAGGTTGAQTINKTVGTVNFAAAATSLVVTNNLVTTSSIITATVGTNDTTMKSVAVVAAAGSFTLHANAAATAETRVNFHVFN